MNKKLVAMFSALVGTSVLAIIGVAQAGYGQSDLSVVVSTNGFSGTLAATRLDSSSDNLIGCVDQSYPSFGDSYSSNLSVSWTSYVTCYAYGPTAENPQVKEYRSCTMTGGSALNGYNSQVDTSGLTARLSSLPDNALLSVAIDSQGRCTTINIIRGSESMPGPAASN